MGGLTKREEERDGITEIGDFDQRLLRPLRQLHLLELRYHLVPLLIDRGRRGRDLLDCQDGDA